MKKKMAAVEEVPARSGDKTIPRATPAIRGGIVVSANSATHADTATKALLKMMISTPGWTIWASRLIPRVTKEMLDSPVFDVVGGKIRKERW